MTDSRGAAVKLPAAPHAASTAELLASLRSDGERGLTREEAAARLGQYGRNRLPDPPRESEILRFLQQFTSPLVLVLLAAALVATLVGFTNRGASGSVLTRFADALAILGIVLLNAVLGYVQEHRAATALAALRRLSAPISRVIRDGTVQQIPAEEVVPGDVLALAAGDAVTADGRLLHTVDLTTDESTLTGESIPTGKSERVRRPRPNGSPSSQDDIPLGDQSTMVFLGTTIVHGTGRALVVRTGGATELGHIGLMLAELTEEPPPLELELRRFGRQILWLCLLASGVLFGWGLFFGGESWSTLLLQAVSFAVAAIPEGLPAITTIALALGTQRMARHGVIVRKLAAIEALGAASVICTDKTGTLTQNQMTVRTVSIAGQRYTVSGEGYAPSGAILAEGGHEAQAIPPDGPLGRLLGTALLCNNAHLTEGTGGEPRRGIWKVVGDPTEGALLVLARKGGLTAEGLAQTHRRVGELPFDSTRKRMAVLVACEGDGRVVHVKGGLDELLPRCATLHDQSGVRPLGEPDRQAFVAEAERLGRMSLRVLAFAYREVEATSSESLEQLEGGALTFLGLVGMLDPPREGVKEAITTCRQAGIRVLMITGDHPATAHAIGGEIGLLDGAKEPAAGARYGDDVLTGSELARLSDGELLARIGTTRIFARTTAEQKLRIVHALKVTGHVVAMTGDGVNDAPALREAHVGIAMGKDGTDVARQAAGIVLTDDNFATIVAGIREGRAIYRNIQKFIFYLLSSNAALAVAVFAAAFYPHGLPLTPLMVLIINLVTNGLPALALGVDPPDDKQMSEPPRMPGQGLFNLKHYAGMLYVGLLMGVPAVLLYYWAPAGSQLTPEWSRSMAFAVLGFGPLFHAWNCHSPHLSIFSQRPLLRPPLVVACLLSGVIQLAFIAVPALRRIIHAYPLSLRDWLVAGLLSASIIPTVELSKAGMRLWLRRRSQPPPPR